MADRFGNDRLRFGEALPVGKAGLDLLLAFLRFADQAGGTAAAPELMVRQLVELLSLVAEGKHDSVQASRTPQRQGSTPRCSSGRDPGAFH